MTDLFLTIGVFAALSLALFALLTRLLFRAVAGKISRESLTPQDILALQSAAEDLVRRIEDAADVAIARLEAKEREIRELLQTRDTLILSSSDISDL